MLVHKSCDLKDVDGRDAVAHARRGVYFHGSVAMSFEPFNTPSGMGGVQIVIANDYSMGEGGAYITSIECYDCGGTVESFPEIESYKLERFLDTDPQEYDLEEA